MEEAPTKCSVSKKREKVIYLIFYNGMLKMNHLQLETISALFPLVQLIPMLLVLS